MDVDTDITIVMMPMMIFSVASLITVTYFLRHVATHFGTYLGQYAFPSLV